MKQLLVIIFLGVLFYFPAYANNVQITGKAELDGSVGTDNMATVKFKLSWENSWNDGLNWDAVYVFLKYRVEGTDGVWHHAYLEEFGHTAGSAELGFWPSNTNSLITGVYVQRAKRGAGNIAQTEIKLRWNITKGSRPLSKTDFDDDRVDIAAMAIEMVYVPYGGFGLGDGISVNTFQAKDGESYIIDADAATFSIPVKGGAAVSMAAKFPKGYYGFYCMKYEVSQEQYVRFLNKLNYPQQKERIGNALENLQPGEYVFGNKTKPNFRNGIILEKKESGKSAVFSHNLNGNNTYAEDGDGQTIACNFMTPQDMLAYCSWATLRPMSELEYEKACRAAYPSVAMPGEYAWNTTSITGKATTASNAGEVREKPDKGNVNAGNAYGPMRCGSFAGPATYQQEAGATWWGIMEMSGNLSELCYNANYAGSTFTGEHGLGVCNTNLTGWPVLPTQFAVRGGSFASPDSLLRISDRSQAAGNYFKNINTQRDSTVTFRGIHTVSESSSRPFDAGNIVCFNGQERDTVCANAGAYFVTSKKDAIGGAGNIQYIWYVSENGATWDVVEGQTSASLAYTRGLVNTSGAVKVYKFRRKAFSSVKDAFSNEVAVQVVPSMTLDKTSLSVKNCQAAQVTASLGVPGKISWVLEGGKVIDSLSNVKSHSYSPTLGDFGETTSANVDATVICIAEFEGCMESLPVRVQLDASTASFTLAVRATSAVSPNHSLPVVVTGVPVNAKIMWSFEDKELIPKPLTGSSLYQFFPQYGHFGSGGSHLLTVRAELNNCVATKDILVHVTDSLKAKTCPANVTDVTGNATDTYVVRKLADGRCWMTTNIRRTDVAYTYPNALATNAPIYGCLYSWTVAMAGQTAERSRGICPEGWHIPTDDEWKNLEMKAVGSMTIETADVVGWRGTTEGTILHATSNANLTWSNSAGAAVAFLNHRGYYWTSTKGAFYRYIGSSNSSYGVGTASYQKIYRSSGATTAGYSVRCVMD